MKNNDALGNNWIVEKIKAKLSADILQLILNTCCRFGNADVEDKQDIAKLIDELIDGLMSIKADR